VFRYDRQRDVKVTVKNSVKCKKSPVYSSSLIVGVASVGDKTPQISLSRGVVLSQSTFHLVIIIIIIITYKALMTLNAKQGCRRTLRRLHTVFMQV